VKSRFPARDVGTWSRRRRRHSQFWASGPTGALHSGDDWGMEDDEENPRDYEAKLYVADLEIASVAEQIPPELLSVFTDEMFRTRTRAEVTHPPKTMLDGSTSEFAALGPVIADRLDILGFTPARVRATLDGVLDETRKMAELVKEFLPDESKAAHDTKRSHLADYTANDWIAELRAATGGSAAQGRPEPGSADWLMSLITDTDRLIALRAALLACPDHEVRLDVTWHYAGGAIETIDGLCSSALDAMRAAASGHAPIVVLAEGKTDIEFLASVLRLLYPHLVDLIRFMDFGHRPTGGAAPLVATVKAFAAAGIANRVVALFDNDTAAADALRLWDRSGLPASIRVFQYPPLGLAADYPTLAPRRGTRGSPILTLTDSPVPSSCISDAMFSPMTMATCGQFTGTPTSKACAGTRARSRTRMPYRTPTARRSETPTLTDPDWPSKTGQA